jgi:hypothetical protein
MQTIDRSASIVIEPYVFRREEWDTIENDTGQAVKGIPGTWFRPNGLGATKRVPAWMIGMACCPNCKQVSIISRNIHKIGDTGRLFPSFICKYQGCSFHRDAYLDMWNAKPLYACAVMRDGNPEMHYMHADNPRAARIQLGPGNYHVVAVGRAIGMFAEDKHGEKLSAD